MNKADEKVLYICRYDDEDLDSGLVGMLEKTNQRDLASIDDLILDMNRQKIELLNGDHADGYLIPWEKYLIVREGVAVWNEEVEEYFIVGTINEIGEITILNQKIINRKKYAVVKEQITLYFPSNEDDVTEYIIECGEAFNIVGEVVYHIGTESIVHYVVNISADYNPFTIPSSKVLIAHSVQELEKVRALI